MGDGDFDVSGIAEEAVDFLHGTAGKDDVHLLGFGEFEFVFEEGEAAAVGGDEGELAVAEAGVDAVQYEAGVVRGDGEFRAFEAFGEHGLRDFEFAGFAEFGQGGEFLGIKAVEFELGPVAFDGGDGFDDVDGDFAVAHFADDALELFGRQGDGAGAVDVGRYFAYDGEFHVGGGHAQFAIVRFNQDVGQDGHGGAAGDHVHDLVQPVEQDLFGNSEFHICQFRCGDCTRAGRRRQEENVMVPHFS